MVVGDIGNVTIYDPQGQIGTGAVVNVRVSLDDTVVLEEHYDSVDSGIVIRDLRKVVLDNWESPNLALLTYTLFNGAFLKIEVTLPDFPAQNVTSTQPLRYCSLRMNGVSMADRFLSRNLEKNVTLDSLETVSILPVAARFIRLDIAYLKDGKAVYIQDLNKYVIGSIQNFLFYTYLVSIRECLEKYSADSLIYVRLCALDSSKVELDRITFNLLEYRPLNTLTYLYRNPFGVPEAIDFLGRVTETFDPQNELAHTLEGYLKVNDDTLETYKVRTGALSPEKRESVKDLLRSYEVYELTGGEIGERVTIIESEAQRDYPANTITSYTLTFQKAGYHRDEFFREKYVAANVFDETFDYTFE